MGTTTRPTSFNQDLTLPRRCEHCGVRPNWFGMRFGIERHRIQINGVPYQDRYMLCLGLVELRLHKFWRGDNDRAPHDHPWWFITFPFSSYSEWIPYLCATGRIDEKSWWRYESQIVKGWRFHFRPAHYQHIVVTPPKPFWTFVISGRKTREWGFWTDPENFINHRNWCDSVTPR